MRSALAAHSLGEYRLARSVYGIVRSVTCNITMSTEIVSVASQWHATVASFEMAITANAPAVQYHSVSAVVSITTSIDASAVRYTYAATTVSLSIGGTVNLRFESFGNTTERRTFIGANPRTRRLSGQPRGLFLPVHNRSHIVRQTERTQWAA